MENKYFKMNPQEYYNACSVTLANCKYGLVHAKAILRVKEQRAFNHNFKSAQEADKELQSYIFWKNTVNFWKQQLVTARANKRTAWNNLNKKEK